MKLLLFLLLPISVFCQNVSFRAAVSATRVVVGQPFEVSFRLENAQAADFRPPALSADFNAMGPSTSNSFQYINGRTAQAQAYTYVLYAKRAGKFTIPPAGVTLPNGQRLNTQPIQIQVEDAGEGKAQNGQNPSGQKVFVRLLVSNTNPVVGEQVSLDVKIYTLINIDQIDVVQQPLTQAANIFAHQMRSFDNTPGVEMVNGRQYTTKVLHRTVLFPTKSGQIELGPALVEIGISDGGNDPFYMGHIHHQTLTTETVALQVGELPPPPPHFAGAVGEFEMQTYIEKQRLTTDDVTKVFVRINGAGDLKQILPPKIVATPDNFEIFPPEIEEDLRESGAGLGGVKTFEYTLSPKALGTCEIRPTFVFFDSKKRQYVVRDTGFMVEVAQGNRVLANIAAVDTNKTAKNTLQLTVPQSDTVLKIPTKPHVHSPLFWAFCLLPMGSLGGVFWYKKRRADAPTAEALESMPKYAQNIASKHFQTAKKHLQSGDTSAFFHEIAHALQGYLSGKFQLPLAEFSRDSIQAAFAENAVDSALAQRYFRLIQSCEMAVFAGMANVAGMQSTLLEAETLLRDFEKALNAKNA